MEFTKTKSNKQKTTGLGTERGYTDAPAGNPTYHEHDGIGQPRLYPKYFHGYPIYDAAPTFKAEEGVSVLVNTNYEIQFDTLVGTFLIGETIQDSSGNEAVVVAVYSNKLVVSSSGTHIDISGTITGLTSGATANILHVSGNFVYWYTMLNKQWNLMSINSFSPTNDLTINNVTIGGGTTITKIISNTATLNFGAIAVNTAADLTMLLSGAAIGDTVSIGVADGVISGGVNCADITFFAWVSATDTVKIRCLNGSAVNIANPASGTFRSTIISF